PVAETAARTDAEEETKRVVEKETKEEVEQSASSISFDATALELITQMVAERAELPSSAVNPDSRLLSDLHLNSITVSQLIAEAARSLHLPRPVSPTDFADATIAEVAQALDEQSRIGNVSTASEVDSLPPGVDSWIR